MTTTNINNGRFRFGVSYRKMRSDEGLSITVNGPVKTVEQQLLRFDCFERSPHFHTAVYDHNTITAVQAEDPARWSLDKIGDEFSELVNEAGGDSVQDAELQAHSATMQQLRDESAKLIAEAKAD